LVIWIKRKLAKRELQFIAKLALHLFDDRMKETARRTLKITKFFEARGCVWRTQRVWRIGSGYTCQRRRLSVRRR